MSLRLPTPAPRRNCFPIPSTGLAVWAGRCGPAGLQQLPHLYPSTSPHPSCSTDAVHVPGIDTWTLLGFFTTGVEHSSSGRTWYPAPHSSPHFPDDRGGREEGGREGGWERKREGKERVLYSTQPIGGGGFCICLFSCCWWFCFLSCFYYAGDQCQVLMHSRQELYQLNHTPSLYTCETDPERKDSWSPVC